MPFYRSGINGNDKNDSRRFFKLIEKFNKKGFNLGQHLCVKGRQRHFLFPTCPKSQNRPKGYHHLYLGDDGVWVCTDHGGLTFEPCGECDYPIATDAPQGTPCPRCLRPVRRCRYCGPITGKRFSALPESEPQRCSHCRNLMEGLTSELLFPDATSQLDYPAFCPNILGCPAGAEPWRTASEFDLVTCRACEAAHHIPRAQLAVSVARCPLCLMLIGEAVGLRLRTHTYDQVEACLARNNEVHRQKNRGREINFVSRCLICGTLPLQIMAWIQRQLAVDSPNDTSPDERDAKEAPPSGGDSNGNRDEPDETNGETKKNQEKAGETEEMPTSFESEEGQGGQPEDEPEADLGEGFFDSLIAKHQNIAEKLKKNLPKEPSLILALHLFQAMQHHRDPATAFRDLQSKTGKTLELLEQDYLERLTLLFEDGSRQQEMVQKRIFELLNHQAKMQSNVKGKPKQPPHSASTGHRSTP